MMDQILQQRVEDALAWEPRVDAAHVGITAQDGVVTLSGFVSSYAQKIAVERATHTVKGVRAIAQEIEVRLPSDQKRSDDEIARRMLDILLWDETVPDHAVMVKVEHGVITLDGEVRWQFQRVRAENLAYRLGGVVQVLRDRLRKVVAARCEMIQAWDVDPTEPRPDGRHRPQDQAVSV